MEKGEVANHENFQGKELIMLKNRNVTGLAVFLMLVFTVAALGNTGNIEKVLSGGLIQIGDSFVARFTGIAVPPRDDALGNEIYDFTKRTLEGQTVKFFTWTTDNTSAGIVYDEDGRPFVQVYYGEGLSTSFNETLLEKGFARVDAEYLPDDLKHYFELEKEAREKGLGIWAKK